MQIAIDGPASSGKGTVARLVARRLGLSYIDTGAMYRSVAYFAERQGVDWGDGAGLEGVARGLVFTFGWDGEGLRVGVNGEDVTAAIRSAELGQGASRVSVFPGVRQALLRCQRELAERGLGVVMEGRDIGTVVLPGAELKVFLHASLEVRAHRRAEEFRRKGQEVSESSVQAELLERDARDRGREVAPLREAADARRLDTTAMSAEQAAELIVSWARELG